LNTVQGLGPLSTDRGRLGAANQISQTGNRVPVSSSLNSRRAHAEAPGDLTDREPAPLSVALEHARAQRHHMARAYPVAGTPGVALTGWKVKAVPPTPRTVTPVKGSIQDMNGRGLSRVAHLGAEPQSLPISSRTMRDLVDGSEPGDRAVLRSLPEGTTITVSCLATPSRVAAA
jgi:hypothetical protein